MDTIEQTLQDYRTPNSWWPMPLINELQAIDLNLLIPWVSGCILAFIEAEGHPLADTLRDGVGKVLSTTTPDESQALIDEYEREGLRGDNIIASFLHLVQARHLYLSSPSRGPFVFGPGAPLPSDVIAIRTKLVWAMILLGDTDFGRRTNIAFVVDRFNQARLNSEKPK